MSEFGKQTVLAAALLLFSQTITIARASADSVCFVLREYDGRIALMEEGESEPIAIYKTPISSLYPKDAELLREGIRLENCTELSQLIEDLELE
ncbi:MAG: hypothetical protein ACI4JS_09915 [Oscillospiraceae bacterium]